VIGARKFSRNIDTSEEQSAKNLVKIRKAEREFRPVLPRGAAQAAGDVQASPRPTSSMTSPRKTS
jgi:hypothetical protein